MMVVLFFITACDEPAPRPAEAPPSPDNLIVFIQAGYSEGYWYLRDLNEEQYWELRDTVFDLATTHTGVELRIRAVRYMEDYQDHENLLLIALAEPDMHHTPLPAEISACREDTPRDAWYRLMYLCREVMPYGEYEPNCRDWWRTEPECALYVF